MDGLRLEGTVRLVSVVVVLGVMLVVVVVRVVVVMVVGVLLLGVVLYGGLEGHGGKPLLGDGLLYEGDAGTHVGQPVYPARGLFATEDLQMMKREY